MVLAEKIIALRKKNGWSQEELAQQLCVSRQAVSKWESEASIPDLDKILRMSQLFGVSTDYLLKDELEELAMEPQQDNGAEESVRVVSLEEANLYLEQKKKAAKWQAFAVAMLIASPIMLMTLGACSELPGALLSEGLAAGIGLVWLLIIVGLSVAALILKGMPMEQFEYLEKESFVLPYGVEGIIRKRQAETTASYQMGIAGGVMLCILSPIPLLLAACAGAPDLICVLGVDLLLLLVAAAVFLFIRCSAVWGGCRILLQEGDYTRERKRASRYTGVVASIYWCIVVCIYLGISFTKNNWQESWMIWPCAGVLYGAICGIMRLLHLGEKEADPS